MAQQKQRIVLAACGCFSPITNLHLRLFELARDFLQGSRNIAVVGGMVSPTHDAYGKKGLVSGEHRLNMCRLATQSSDWISVSDWEITQSGWTQTVRVLRELQRQTSAKAGWEDVNVRFLCGADLLESFSVPGLWKDEDIEEIVGRFGVVVVSRTGYNPQRFIYKSPILLLYQHNIEIVTEWIANAVSSTKIRHSLARGQSIRYMVPDSVVDYIKRNPTLYPLNVLDQFKLSDEDLDNLTGKFHTDLIESLSKESHASPLHVQISPLPERNSVVCRSIVLSWTATGISIYQVTINGSDCNAQPLEGMTVLPSDVKTLDSLVEKLSKYLVEAVKIADTSLVVLMHDFATSDVDDKLTIKCANGPNCWELKGDGNVDIFSLLKNMLQTKGINMKTISNIDAGLAYGVHNDSVTVTLGSNNSNAYFCHTADKVPRVDTSGAKLLNIVTNWATFGEQNNSLSEYNADFDLVLDAESNDSGRNLFTKVVSDAYLIDIVWRVSISMVAEGTLFNGKLPSVMDKDTFVALIGCIANNKCDAKSEALQRLLDQFAVQVTAEDLATLSNVTSIVYQRAAKFVAVGIAAVLREIKKEECTVTVTGPSRVCLWLELIQSAMNHLLPGCKVKLTHDKNGVLFGTALHEL